MARKRGRITVQSQPTGAARTMRRLMGVVHAVFGGVLDKTLNSLTVTSPEAEITVKELDSIWK